MPERLFHLLNSRPDGLTGIAAGRRLRRYGRNEPQPGSGLSAMRLLLRQFQNPLILILIAAAAIAASLHDTMDAAIVLAIVLVSTALSFVQEYQASSAIDRLRARVQTTARVLRSGQAIDIPGTTVVPGDVVVLSAGDLIPADGVVLSSKDFFVTQSVLTGEPLPVEKQSGQVGRSAAIGDRTNCVFAGTSVRSGTAKALIVQTGRATVFGSIADRLRLRPPETEFERGIRRYGYLLTQIMLVLVLAVFAANVFLARPPIDSLLFAMALAVGMSPELLPAIISVTLSRGAREMAGRGVIVRRLSAIENLGSMDILCTDKTGTLTEGVVALDAALDATGAASSTVLRLAYLNARLQTGLVNALDEAIVGRGGREGVDLAGSKKVDEVPYDFVRKRLSVVVEATGTGSPRILIAKGALAPLLDVCERVTDGGLATELGSGRRAHIEALFAGWSAQGYRVLGLATKPVEMQAGYSRADEAGLVFEGFLLFFDPPKPDIRTTLASLAGLGVQVKIITGDNRLVAAHLAETVGMSGGRLLIGAQLGELREEALLRQAEETDIFAEVDPGQKERIILALKKAGHVVGFLGDGINDASALHAADVGISVDQAVDVAKEAADFVLLEHDLDVLRRGIEQGRITFANTLKYISITTSANFGNMISMAAASMFLPFLPLLAKQILLNNFLSDVPAMAIAGDAVDANMVERPHRWHIGEVRRFMIVFGLLSSAFDFVVFAVLLLAFDATPEVFRTGWFVESLMTELAIVMVIRTTGPFYRSRPGRLLLVSTVAVMVLTLVLPYLPGAGYFGFVPLPPAVLGTLVAITALYVLASELVKRRL